MQSFRHLQQAKRAICIYAYIVFDSLLRHLWQAKRAIKYLYHNMLLSKRNILLKQPIQMKLTVMCYFFKEGHYILPQSESNRSLKTSFLQFALDMQRFVCVFCFLFLFESNILSSQKQVVVAIMLTAPYSCDRCLTSLHVNVIRV